MSYRVTVKLEYGQLTASLPDGRTLRNIDPVVLADMLHGEGVTATQVHMPDWREESAPFTGHKIALLARLRAHAI